RPGDSVMHTRVAVLACCLAVGCGGGSAEPFGPFNSRPAYVQAGRVAAGVQVTNTSQRPVAYAVWNRGWLALFAPCTNTGPECPRLAPGHSITVPVEEIAGWAPGATEAVVRWWHVIPDGAGGLRADDVHMIIVGL
ncbi:MAG TPA: hypothetical protein VK922_02775, partial [Gemmatimonadaceae bacterium]|nr:hypothetical protein [Gemmatimonadaceae bacterium]